MNAETTLGAFYVNGWGIPKDYGQALAWYQKAADQGDAAGEEAVGGIYFYGLGVTKDYGRALAWFQKAAAQRDVNAENHLGWMYQHGLGVQQDNAQAIAWYRKATAQGSSTAQKNLVALTLEMTGDPKAQIKLVQISPIFSQIVAFSAPSDFVKVYENTFPVQVSGHTNLHAYIRQLGLSGETADHWSQMITVTGFEGAASVPSISAKKTLDKLESGFSKTCPASFSSIDLGSFDVGIYHAYAEVVSCGSDTTSPTPQSKSGLAVTIVGDQDVYGIEWDIKGAPSTDKVLLDKGEWEARLQQLQPIKLCPKGEQAPYASCTGSSTVGTLDHRTHPNQ